MNPLTHEQVLRLQAILEGVVPDRDALTHFAGLWLRTPLDHVVPPGKSVPQAIYVLIEAHERDGRTRELLQGLANWQHRNEAVVAFCAGLGVRPEDKAVLATALVALPPLLKTMAEGDLMFVLGELRGAFETCRDQIRCLQKYKALHDGLHGLQWMLFSVAHAAAHFVRDPVARQTLLSGTVDLGRLARDARRHADGLPTQEDEEAWIKVLAGAAADMGAALKANDAPGMAQAVTRLRAVLKQADEVDGHLLFVARQLPLGRLTKAMRAIDGRLSGGEGRAEADQFRAGVTALERIGESLKGLIREHNAWQELEAEFALAETQTAAVAPAARFADWATTRDRLRALCAGHADEALARELSEAAGRYEAATPDAAPLEFYDMRVRFIRMFSDIDRQLLDLTEELSHLADRMDTLVRFLNELTLSLPARAVPAGRP